MANNKVQLANGTVLIDLTADTVSPQVLSQGYTAHDKAGNAIVGTATGGAKPEQAKTATENGTVYPDSGYALSSVTVAIPVYDGSVS